MSDEDKSLLGVFMLLSAVVSALSGLGAGITLLILAYPISGLIVLGISFFLFIVLGALGGKLADEADEKHACSIPDRTGSEGDSTVH